MVTIQQKLFRLVIAAVLPASVAAILAVGYTYRLQRTAIEQSTLNTARALADLVNDEFQNAQHALQVLARSPYLEGADLAAFHREAREVLQTLPGNAIALADRDGQQVLNTLYPYGAALPPPPPASAALVRRAFDTGRPVISDLLLGAVSGQNLISIGVPVMRGGRVAYYLSMGIFSDRMNDLLSRQKLPPGWIAGLVDGQGVIGARTVNAQAYVGKTAAPELRAAMARSAEGHIAAESLEGIPFSSVYSRAPGSNWTVAIGIPEVELVEALWTPVLGVLAVAVLLLGLGAVLAGRARTQVAGAIRGELLLAAEALGRGETPAPARPQIREVDEVGRALTAAAGQLAQAREDVRRLAAASNAAHEKDMARAARDLHEDLAQQLVALKLALEQAERDVPAGQDALKQQLSGLIDRISAGVAEARRLAADLRPIMLDQLGLAAAVEWLVEDFQKRHGLRCRLTVRLDDDAELPGDLSTAVYRVLQESLANIARHAGASTIDILIAGSDDELQLRVADDGRGFNAGALSAPDSHGVLKIRERAYLLGGSVSITSADGGGTAVEMRLPLRTRQGIPAPDGAPR